MSNKIVKTTLRFDGDLWHMVKLTALLEKTTVNRLVTNLVGEAINAELEGLHEQLTNNNNPDRTTKEFLSQITAWLKGADRL